jgi:hypothetical protein
LREPSGKSPGVCLHGRLPQVTTENVRIRDE